MSPELSQALLAAGWMPGRSVPINDWINELNRYGFSVVPESLPILQSLGGLSINPERSVQDVYSTGVVVFEPLILAEEDRVAHWEHLIRSRLTPIGQVGTEICLLVDETGRIYGYWNDILYKFGESLEDALERSLVFGKVKPETVAVADEPR